MVSRANSSSSLTVLTLLTMLWAGNVAPQLAAEQPNILFIMIDDLGWKDLNCQGSPQFTTPNIDRLAKQGMRFTDAYAAAPVCSPTRAAAVTGLAPGRVKVTNHLPDRWQFYNRNKTMGPTTTNQRARTTLRTSSPYPCLSSDRTVHLSTNRLLEQQKVETSCSPAEEWAMRSLF